MPIRTNDMVQVTLLGEALEHLRIPVIVAQEDGNRVAANQAACELTGYSRAELLAVPAEQLSGRSKREHERKLLDFARHGRAPGHGPLRRKDGSIVEVDYRWAETRVAGMDFYVFLLTPAGTESLKGEARPRKGRR